MNTILSNVFVGWTVRRVQELGGIAAILYGIYMGLPPDAKAAINDLFNGGDWRNMSLGTVVGLVLYLAAQAQSLFATVRPQIVSDGQKVPIKDLPAAAQTLVTQKAATAVEKKRVKPMFGRK